MDDRMKLLLMKSNYKKAPNSIIFTDEEFIASLNDMQSLNEYSQIVSICDNEWILTSSNDEHPINSCFSIDFNDYDNLTVFNEVQL
ncbi:hypothetical protein M9Y10_040550 [Tritrichomonas musculus]|uniref:Uncharacterized protein n=1 Tax=Tritrichomonas musculus TaxID=1915356 RepID=A0ABR2GPZ3_9EUKA